ncbi:MAG: leader peptide processing enzyme [Treponema sp.]|nr:leader peptide processing enzyme [Treponema sp.]
MNKKVNTILFILGATLFNVIVAVISFIIFTAFYVNFIMKLIPEQGRAWGFILIFLASLAISFIVYRVALKFLLTKIQVDKYFDPLFVKSNMRK